MWWSLFEASPPPPPPGLKAEHQGVVREQGCEIVPFRRCPADNRSLQSLSLSSLSLLSFSLSLSLCFGVNGFLLTASELQRRIM